MMKRLLSMILCASLCLMCFAGCRVTEAPSARSDSEASHIPSVAEATDPPAGTEATEEPQESADPIPRETTQSSETDSKPDDARTAFSDAKNLGFTDFDNRLIAFLNQTDLSDGNYTVSPLSFKAALALAAVGAEDETQAQLLAALGFENREQMDDWYRTVLEGQDLFEEYFQSSRITDRGDAAYRVVNSVWKNEDLPGDFREVYLNDLDRRYRAEAYSAPAAELARRVNSWVDEKTEGLIPQLLADASDASAVLVNALYLKAGWMNAFSGIGPDAFATAAGDTVEKDYMRATGSCVYYADEETQLVSVPLQGGVDMVFVLGEDEGLAEKLAKAERRQVEVTVPMFDVETTLDRHELCNYLRAIGCGKLFTVAAELDPMFTEPLYFDDIVQKAKVHIDEDGLEAAAATAISVFGATAVEPKQPEIFRADRAFRFYIVNGVDAPELLFWGQIVE